jgi:hypothetical protein
MRYLRFFWVCVGCIVLSFLWLTRYSILNPNADFILHNMNEGVIVSLKVLSLNALFLFFGTLSLLIGAIKNKELRKKFWNNFCGWGLFLVIFMFLFDDIFRPFLMW